MSEFFGRLETELRAAAERPPRRAVPVPAIAVAGLLALALAPVVLVLGSGGDERAPEREAASDATPRAPGVRIDHRGVRYEPPGATVLATGTSPVSGPWQLHTYEQDEGGRCIGVSLIHADPQAMGVPQTPDQKEYFVYVMTLPPDVELDGVMRWIGEDGRPGDEVRFRLP